MRLHVPELARIERAGLEQHPVRDRDLSDVMRKPRFPQRDEVVVSDAQCTPQGFTQ
jgi:hypothetical protein